MKLIIVIICVLITIGVSFSCNQDKDWKHIKTVSLTDKVFVEKFYISYGVHAGGSKKYFVTDSLTYHICIGDCDDKEYLAMDVDGSTLIIEKYSRRNLKNGKSNLIETKTISLPLAD